MSEIISSPAYGVLTHRLCLRCWNPEDVALLKAAVNVIQDHLSPWTPSV
jgi:hypothetical protein